MHLEPIVSFAILLAIILIVPLIFERLKLPGILGLLLTGVLLGPNGLQVLDNDSETMRLLSGIGLVYLLFMAGLEIDLAQFRATKYRSAGFGFLTFAVPLITGTIVGRLFGFDWNPSILIGSLFASHTLLAYPIISRLGVVNNEAVTVTIGATIFTDVGALLVLAVCVGINKGNFSALSLGSLLLALLIYSAVILFGFSWLGKEFFRRSGDEEGNQFLFVLLVVFVSALGAELIGVEKIVGAFLAGLAVNSIVGDGPVKEKILFVGTVLFVPIFFVDVGLLIDLPAFVRSMGAIGLTLTILVGLIGSKFLAALLAQLAYRYSWREGITMWSLSMPQVAATLAATFVGYREGMLTEDVLNSVIVLMLVTSTLGPLITARAAAGLTPTSEPLLDLEIEQPEIPSVALEPEQLTIVVPVYNPNTERNLLEMAALLAQHAAGRIVPLAVAPAHAHMDAPELDQALQRSRALLARATELGQEFGAVVEPLLRIDDNVAQGISRASREQEASLIVMGWGQTAGLRARLFGSLIDRTLWSAHCPVAVTRLLQPAATIRRILVPVETPARKALQTVRFASILAKANQVEMTLLHVVDPHSSPDRMTWLKSQLDWLSAQANAAVKPEIQILQAEDVVSTIVQQAHAYDLVILRASRRRSSGIGELTLGSITVPIVKQLNCSVITLGEPQRKPLMRPLYRSHASSVSNSAKSSTA
ncbi:universal stress protein [Leptolyngbya sp. NK1-12]|uniref:Universal stress protein n=1 Tax=Leptolyngbya sp. NK1-12 TaxID=2547451 RepID=A0AA96WEC5_9CYAN|nr:universal stress protein [Leptolyngbya sp. NK1-12]